METQKKKKSGVLFGIVIAVLVLLAVVIVAVILNAREDADETVDPMCIQTKYAALQFPAEYADYIRHEEILDGTDAVEVFSMLYEQKELELFRLSFTREEKENAEGYWDAGEDLLCISVSISTLELDAFLCLQDSGEWETDVTMQSTYYSMLGQMATVLQSVKESPNYRIIKTSSANANAEERMLYWNVTLPANVFFEQSDEDGVKAVRFFTQLSEKEIELYTITLENQQTDSAIGRYSVNGKTVYVSVEVSGEIENEALSENEREYVYTLLESINDVIAVIRQDSDFRDLNDA